MNNDQSIFQSLNEQSLLRLILQSTSSPQKTAAKTTLDTYFGRRPHVFCY